MKANYAMKGGLNHLYDQLIIRMKFGKKDRFSEFALLCNLNDLNIVVYV